jgi:hypothetical protein
MSNVGFKDTVNFDAFGRLRVSQAHSLFESQFTYDLQPLLYEQFIAGSGAAISKDTTNNCALITFADTPDGGTAYMQTFEHFRYTSGKSQFVMLTFNMNGGAANTLKFVGYSDGIEGIEFRLNGTTPQFAILSTTAAGNQIIDRDNWSYDTFDGSGPSGIEIDFTKTQILVIDLQALYVGRVRIGFDIDGIIYLAHAFEHANKFAVPYFKTANLPLRCGMTCSGVSSTTMLFICSTCVSEGGEFTAEGYHFAQEGTVTAASGARTHLLSLQPKPTFNSVVNRSKFILESLDLVVTGNSPIIWELCIGDALTGTTTFNDVNTTYSTFEYNIAGTTSGTPAIVIAKGYLPATAQNKGVLSSSVPFRYPICLDAAGNARLLGRLTVLVTGIGGSSACRGTINWKEIR